MRTKRPALVVKRISITKNTNCLKYRDDLSKYDWDIVTAYAIMQAENHACDPAADNSGLNTDGTNDVGLMQVNSIHVDSGLISEAGRRDPAQNIKAAYTLYKGAGSKFTPWSSYNNKSYLQFIR